MGSESSKPFNDSDPLIGRPESRQESRASGCFRWPVEHRPRRDLRGHRRHHRTLRPGGRYHVEPLIVQSERKPRIPGAVVGHSRTASARMRSLK